MKRITSIIVPMLFAFFLTGLCFAQSPVNPPASEKSSVEKSLKGKTTSKKKRSTDGYRAPKQVKKPTGSHPSVDLR